MQCELLIRNVNAVLEDRVIKADIAIADGRIVGIFQGEHITAQQEIQGQGKYLLPGGIDTHSHFFEPGPSYREDFYHGTRAAAMGGYTTVMDMPNTDPPVDSEEHFIQKQKIFSENAHVDYMIWAAALPGQLFNIPKLKQMGAPAFKAFTLDAGPVFPYSDSLALYEGMKMVKSVDGIYAIHAEDPDIVNELHKRYQGQEWSLKMHDKARPWYAELAAINKVIFWAKMTGCPLHICHTSIPEGVELVNEMRAQGMNITVETCPHYLLFDYEEIADSSTFGMICPPVRNKSQRDKMWDYVADGSLNYMGTDHAPYTWEDKHPGNDWDAPGGGPNIDVAIPAVLEEGIKNRKLSYMQMAAFLATNAAKRFGIYPQKGTIQVGADADFILVDMGKSWTYTRKNSFSKTKETGFPYEGRKISCCIEATFVRGIMVYSNGEILVRPGYGKLICP